MRILRLILLALVIAGLSPGLLWRETPDLDRTAPIRIRALPIAGVRAGPLVLEGAWRIGSRSPMFGGYSALLVRGGDTMVAASDGGRMLFLRRENGIPVESYLDRFLRRKNADKGDFDIEAATHAEPDGPIWLAAESANAILAVDSEWQVVRRAAPRAMQTWSTNGGPEAMLRLSDGRFLVLQEDADRWFGDHHRGLIFAGDPTLKKTPPPTAFRFAATPGFDPVDMAQLPDGRVVILQRGIDWSYPPRFPGILTLADPAQIAPGKVWTARTLARLEPPLPLDNFEGLAIEPDEDGSLVVWLISDDNQMVQWQRTLLLKLRWPGWHAKRARGPAARP